AGLPADTRVHLGRVRQLWHPLRADEAGGLDRAQPARGQAFDQGDLGRGRYQRRFVLQAIARADLDDAERRAHGVSAGLRRKRMASPWSSPPSPAMRAAISSRVPSMRTVRKWSSACTAPSTVPSTIRWASGRCAGGTSVSSPPSSDQANAYTVPLLSSGPGCTASAALASAASTHSQRAG